MSITDDLNKRYTEFSPVNRALAKYVLAKPEQFLNERVAEIAANAGVSTASVVRFVHHLGYPDLQRFKLTLAAERPQKGSTPLTTLVEETDDASAVAAKLAQALNNTTRDLQQTIDMSLLDRAANALIKAKRIYLEGIGASALAAQDLYLKLIRANRDAHYDSDAHTALERIYYAQPNDLLIAYSYSGQTREVILAAEQAKRTRTPIIAITRNRPSPLSELADFTFGLPATEELLRIGAVTSLHAQTFVGNLLFFTSVRQAIPYMESNYRETSALLKQLKEGVNNDL